MARQSIALTSCLLASFLGGGSAFANLNHVAQRSRLVTSPRTLPNFHEPLNLKPLHHYTKSNERRQSQTALLMTTSVHNHDFHRQQSSSFAQSALPSIGIYGLLLLQVLVFAADHFFTGNFVKRHLYLYHGPRWFRLWQPLTCLFCHRDKLHLGGNLLLQWFLGRNVEMQYGQRGLLLSFALCGMASSLAALWFLPKYTISIGAAGVTLGWLVLSKVLSLRSVDQALDWRNLLEVALLGSFAWQQFAVEIATTAMGTRRRVPFLLGHVLGVVVGAVAAKGMLHNWTAASFPMPRFGQGRGPAFLIGRRSSNKAMQPPAIRNGWTRDPTRSYQRNSDMDWSESQHRSHLHQRSNMNGGDQASSTSSHQRENSRVRRRDISPSSFEHHTENPTREEPRTKQQDNWWKADPIRETDARGKPLQDAPTRSMEPVHTPEPMEPGPMTHLRHQGGPLAGFPEQNQQRADPTKWDANIRQNLQSRFPSWQGSTDPQLDIQSTTPAGGLDYHAKPQQDPEVKINQTRGIFHDMGLDGTQPTHFNGATWKPKSDPVNYRKSYLNGHEVAASVNPSTGRINYGMDVDMDVKEKREWWQKDALEGWEDKL